MGVQGERDDLGNCCIGKRLDKNWKGKRKSRTERRRGQGIRTLRLNTPGPSGALSEDRGRRQ